MRPSTKTQITNGLRIGGGIGAFFIAAMLLGVATDGLRAGSGHLRPWPDGVIASSLMALAAGILVLTARVWILYIAGCLLFAIPKCLMVVASGKAFYSRQPFSRWEAIDLALFSTLSLFLIYRVIKNHTPAIVDRLAFTFFALSFVFGLSRQDFALVLIWQLAAVAALSLAWFLSHKKHQGRTAVN